MFAFQSLFVAKDFSKVPFQMFTQHIWKNPYAKFKVYEPLTKTGYKRWPSLEILNGRHNLGVQLGLRRIVLNLGLEFGFIYNSV